MLQDMIYIRDGMKQCDNLNIVGVYNLMMISVFIDYLTCNKNTNKRSEILVSSLIK